MRSLPVLALLLCPFLAGCEKKEEAPAPPAKPVAPAEKAEAPVKKAAPAPSPAPVKKAAAEAPAQKAQGIMPVILLDIPESSTVFAAGVEGLDAMVRTFDSIVTAIPAALREDAPPEVLDPTARTAKLGADLSTAAGWTAYGVDATIGGAVTLDTHLPGGPLFYLRATDLKKLIERLTGFGAKIEAKGSADGVDEYLIDGKPAWVGRRGETSVLYVAGDDSPPDAKARFKALLVTKDPPLARDKTTEITFRDLGQGARYWAYSKVDRALDFATKQAGEAVPHGDFIRKRLLALGISAGPATGGLRILTDVKAADALARIFKPKRPDAKFARYFGPQGNLLVRSTLNIEHFFDGIADLIPPDLAQARGQLMVAKNAVPVAVGVQLADLAVALSGHIAVAIDHTSLKKPQPDFMVLLDVIDAAAADKLITTLLDRLNKMQKVPHTATEVAGHKGFKVGEGPAEVVVVRHEDAILLGRQSMVANALANPSTATGELARAIDGDSIYGFVVDVSTLTQTLPPDAKMDAAQVKKMLDAVIGEDLVAGHLTGGLRIDESGIYAVNSRSSAMLIGVLAAVAIPAFMKYIRRSKATEARINLHKMTSQIAMKALEDGFRLQSAPRTPAVRSCDKYGPDAAAWAHPGWAAIDFKLESPHYFQYELIVSADGQSFTGRAYGDLDCDDQESVYEMTGTLTAGELKRGELSVQDGLE